MANYLVLYTIYNDDDSLIRNGFANELEKIGLKKFEDQSTSYGSYDGTLDGLTNKLRTLKAKLLRRGDKVTLFYATNQNLNNYSIEKEDI